jgi:hypothetical protein
MEHGRDRGVHADLPLDAIFETFRVTYGTRMFAAPTDQIADAFTAPA